MKTMRKIVGIVVLLGALLVVVGGGAALAVYYYLEPELPSIETLKDVRFQVPLRIYSADHKLIAEFGEQKSSPVNYADVPPLLVKALLAAEDDRFFEHPGVDYQGLLRAAWFLAATGEKSQGGSTITMQVARNFFLTSEKTYLRKVTEILLALKIDRELSKEEILELYLNKVYLGNRAYGVAAAAQVYYGKTLAELTLPEIAMIVGLPKAPSRYNPIADVERSTIRRNYVLDRMFELKAISASEFDSARKAPETAKVHSLPIEVAAPYVGEMARQDVIARFGEDLAYNSGMVVYTTIDSRQQDAANRALQHGLMAYDERHGYRGPIKKSTSFASSDPVAWSEELATVETVADLIPALIVGVAEQSVHVFLADKRYINIPWDGLAWAKRYINENMAGGRPKAAAEVVSPGDIVVVAQTGGDQWRLAQLPTISGAFIAIDPNKGAISALVGGLEYSRSHYNRVTQAHRQPGSAFKPVVYAAALENGFTPATIINDAPVVFEDPSLEAEWRPENFSGEFFGPTRLREALVHSRNLVSIRVLQSIGINAALDMAQRVGLPADRLPRNLSLSLGSGSITPLELARAHSAFANGGYLITPYFVDRVVDANGQTVFQAEPDTVCRSCDSNPIAASAASDAAMLANNAQQPVPHHAPRVMKATTAYLMNSMMMDVVKRGTARKALALGRGDLAGKTGTTNDQKDAWFVGFNAALLGVAWVGFDEPKPLGNNETGGNAALPVWIEFMAEALEGMPNRQLERPPGLVSVKIDPATGLLATGGASGAIFETFPADLAPTERAPSDAASSSGGRKPDAPSTTQDLF